MIPIPAAALQVGRCLLSSQRGQFCWPYQVNHLYVLDVFISAAWSETSLQNPSASALTASVESAAAHHEPPRASRTADASHGRTRRAITTVYLEHKRYAS